MFRMDAETGSTGAPDDQVHQEYEAELAEYYRTLSDEERAESAAWAALCAQSARCCWDEQELEPRDP